MLPLSLITDLRDGIQIHTDAHAESIRQTLDGLQLKLCEYDAEINVLEDTMANLKKGRADLAHSISVYKSYLAPIRRLPVELLGEIFSEVCAFPFGNAVCETLRSPAQTPLLIASVCSHWRSICLSFPQLWSVMFVDADDINLSVSTKILLSLYQQRSSSKLTTIGISAQFLQNSGIPLAKLTKIICPLTCL
ncbi:hypothetical protein ARMSODRAFT_446205 [Armillaria solidipes]|uniref:Uncharacterized protein n=1 Tax=Armillaria solidipes TaxID=1076256 RepID=A0A2H3B2S4_9AGAR|nr:hypothetical protein ARMSODRAFT_446205 [Armillaria solidipes]